MGRAAASTVRPHWTVGIVLLLIIGFLPLAPAPPAGADSHPQLRAVPWDGCEPPCQYLSGINGWENEVGKYRFGIEVVSDHQPVTIDWWSPTLPGNPESGNLPADAFIGGSPVGVQDTVTGGTTFEWNPGEDRGSNDVNCYYPSTGNTSTGNCYWISITATDSLGQSTTVDVYLRVLEDTNPPTVEILDMSPADGVVAIGETITFTVSGTDTDIPTARFIEYSLHEDPEQSTGATIDLNTGAFSWTPTSGQDGSYLMPILVEEVDPDLPSTQLSSAFVEVPIVVGSGNRPPVVVVATPVINVTAGDWAVTEFSYYDLDYPYQDLSVSLVGAPPGADLFPSDNPDTFAWQTTAADDGKRFEFFIEVSDGIDTTAVPITVNVGTVSTVQISITELVGAADTVTVAGPVVIQITESVGIADTVAVLPSVLIHITEAVSVADPVGVRPPVVIRITEAVGVSDNLAVRPPVAISITESISVSDSATTSPSIFITISESVGVTDTVVVTPPVMITVNESVIVGDSVTVAPEELGSISGIKWADLDGDSNREDGEPPLEGVTIYLDLNTNGSLDGGEPSTLTAVDGSYSFDDLTPGVWVVREIVPAGYTQTFPTANNGGHFVAVTGSVAQSSIDFGNQMTPNGPPVIEPIADVVLDVGEYTEIPVFVSDPEGDPFTKTIEGLPNGVINGVIPYLPLPEHAGMEFLVTVTATQDDNPANFDTETFTVTVNPLNHPAAIEPIGDVFTLPGEEVVITPIVTDAEGDPYEMAWEGPPPNAVINGIFIFNPDATQAGEAFPIVATVLQNGEPVATEVFTVFVGGEPSDPAGSPQIPLVGVAGSSIRVEGSGLEPGSEAGVFLFSDPVLLTTVTVGPDGTFSTTVDLPLDTQGGTHTIVVMGTAGNGEPTSLAADLEVIDDQDEDGLTEFEEMLTGTNPTHPDSDGDGLIDGIDPSWLGEYVADLPSEAFSSRSAEFRIRSRIVTLNVAIAVGNRDMAFRRMASMETRADGCGTTADGDDWITHCGAQAGFKSLLELLWRNVEVMDLPGPPTSLPPEMPFGDWGRGSRYALAIL